MLLVDGRSCRDLRRAKAFVDVATNLLVPQYCLSRVADAIRVMRVWLHPLERGWGLMLRDSLVTARRVVAVVGLPMVAVGVFAGVASADSGPVAEPVAGIPLQSEDVTTNPDALIPDPVLNGASAGASVGSAVGSAVGLATGSVTGSAGSAIGALIGAVVGATNPNVVPQVLP
ncbi:hypothetical protein [Nocardia thraciensis]